MKGKRICTVQHPTVSYLAVPPANLERQKAAARDSGVIVQSYLSDNGKAFTNKEHVAESAAFKQVSHFAGVGAHHHNGVAERNIQTIMSMARTMMLHAAIRWCDTADTTLWPMAVDHAVYIHNHLPNRKNGLAPLDISQALNGPPTNAMVSKYGEVPCMSWILPCRMERNFLDGNLVRVVRFSWDSQRSMPPLPHWCLI